MLLARRALAVLQGRLARNIIANYTGSLINAIVPLIALPFLLQYLGVANWGLVAFSTLMISLMAVLNVGLSQSLIREFGSRWANGSEGRIAVAQLLFGYERIYWLGATVIALSALPFVQPIVQHWLKIGDMPTQTAVTALHCALLLFVFQLPGALYNSLLSALQEQVKQNTVRAGFTLCRGIGGVALVLATHSVIVYLAFIVVATLLETLTIAWLAWRTLGVRRLHLRWEPREVRKTLRFSATMSGLVLLGFLTTQVDKFYVSVKLPIEDLGVYSIAQSIAMGVLQISYPMFVAIQPKLVEIGRDERLRWQINLRLLGTVCVVVLVVGSIYATAGRALLSVWLQDPALAGRAAGVLNWLMLASGLNTIYNVGYINWVSEGETRWIALVNIISFAIALIAAPISIDAFGLNGAALSIVAINAIGATAAMAWLTHRSLRLNWPRS